MQITAVLSYAPPVNQTSFSSIGVLFVAHEVNKKLYGELCRSQLPSDSAFKMLRWLGKLSTVLLPCWSIYVGLPLHTQWCKESIHWAVVITAIKSKRSSVLETIVSVPGRLKFMFFFISRVHNYTISSQFCKCGLVTLVADRSQRNNSHAGQPCEEFKAVLLFSTVLLLPFTELLFYLYFQNLLWGHGFHSVFPILLQFCWVPGAFHWH